MIVGFWRLVTRRRYLVELVALSHMMDLSSYLHIVGFALEHNILDFHPCL
jgi:hypothetical protein